MLGSMKAPKAPSQRGRPYSTTSLPEFQRAFPDERACYDFLLRQLWPDGFVCPRCGGRRCAFVATRADYLCQTCLQHISLTAGTIFHKSKVPLHLWFWLIFLMATHKKGVPALYAQKVLGLKSYQTAWLMGHKLRHAMRQRDAAYQLAGTVEVDESYYGGKRRGGKRGRGSGKTPVLITSENRGGKPGFAQIRVLTGVGEEQVGPALVQAIRAGSTLRTDGLPSYGTAGKRGYTHDRQVLGGDMARTAKVLPWVHVLASNSKRFLLATHHGVAPKYLDRYLAEFTYRYNRRRWHGELFERLLYACVTADPAPLGTVSR